MAGRSLAHILDVPHLRLGLDQRHGPYWHMLGRCRAVGYTRLQRTGGWVARIRLWNHRYRQIHLGRADDEQAPDGTEVLSFSEAIGRAREFFARHENEAMDPRPPADRPLELIYSPVGPVYTVGHAARDYLRFHAQYRHRTRQILYTMNAYVLPDLGTRAVAELTPQELRDWMHRITVQGARLRFSPDGPIRRRAAPTTQEEMRRRRRTVNRIWGLLKAALNMAAREGKAPSDMAWRIVPKYAKVDTPRNRTLTIDECRALIAAAEPCARSLILASLYTGCRISELMAACIKDFDAIRRTLLIPSSKTDRPRMVALPNEAVQFFHRTTDGRPGSDLMFRQPDGRPWARHSYDRPLKRACAAANIRPAIGFHVLRHTYASELAMAGVPLIALARQLGHADLRMVIQCYAHLSPSFMDNMIRERFPRIWNDYPDGVVYIR